MENYDSDWWWDNKLVDFKKMQNAHPAWPIIPRESLSRCRIWLYRVLGDCFFGKCDLSINVSNALILCDMHLCLCVCVSLLNCKVKMQLKRNTETSGTTVILMVTVLVILLGAFMLLHFTGHMVWVNKMPQNYGESHQIWQLKIHCSLLVGVRLHVICNTWTWSETPSLRIFIVVTPSLEKQNHFKISNIYRNADVHVFSLKNKY